MNSKITSCLVAILALAGSSAVAQPFYGHYLSKADGTGGDINFKATAYDAQGNMYVAGQFRGTAAFDNGTTLTSTYAAAIVAKIDVHGHTVWAKQETGVMTDGYHGANDIAVDGNGNVYITGDGGDEGQFGSFAPSNTGSTYSHGFLAKLDNGGNFLWAKGANDIYPTALYADASNDIYMAGYVTDAQTYLGGTLIPGSAVGNSGFIIKIDGSFNLLSSFISDGAGYFTDIDGDASGNIAVCGTYDDDLTLVSGDSYTNPTGVSSSYLTPFVAKFNSSLQVQWAATTYSSYEANFKCVACDAAGNIYTGGYYADTLNLGTGHIINAPTVTSHNHVMAKYSPTGSLVWAQSFGNGEGNDIDFPRMAYSNYTGKLWGLVYVDNGEMFGGTTISQNMGILDIGTADGSIQNVIQSAADSRAYPQGLATWQSSVGVSGGSISNDPGGSTIDLLGLSSPNNYHTNTGFMFEFGASMWPNAVNNVSAASDEVNIYPNPTTGIVTVAAPAANNATIIVTNILGATIMQQTMNSTKQELDLSALPKGTYMINIHSNNGNNLSKKVVLD